MLLLPAIKSRHVPQACEYVSINGVCYLGVLIECFDRSVRCCCYLP